MKSVILQLGWTFGFGLLAASFAIPARGAEPNTLSRPEQLAGWKLLFDGRTKQGWRRFRGGSTDGWKVVDGALVRAENGAGDLITEGQYAFFDLSIDFRITPGANSGVMFGVTEEYDRPWKSGPEVQILDEGQGADPLHRMGALYDLVGVRKGLVRPPGAWNNLYIHHGPDGTEVHVNGVRCYRITIGSDRWNRLVARSKFARYDNFGKAKKGHVCLQDHGAEVAFRNIKIRPIGPDGSVPNPVTGRLPLRPVRVFESVRWSAWEPEDEEGRIRPQRPIVLTHAGDGSGRIFVATQRGVIHVIEKKTGPQKSKVFLDISDRVIYKDRENEEGFLGLAFHPNYRENGRFYVYYTTRHEPHTSVISSFRVSQDKNRADASSEEQILKIKQPYWNHNGGTIAFGPDGYLYIGLGDGGAANDPHGNGQNLKTLLGSILRIDVDKKEGGRPYAIPKDNPFVGTPGARPEIFAYGIRNVWRIAFDRKTGRLWAADVGQNIWEEIDLIQKGGNYGWNYREGLHPFGTKTPPKGAQLIDPIWEYDHTVGKSITGGFVYRGKRLPELVGCYVYADYVTGRIWALRWDERTQRVTANLAIPGPAFPIISFGEDEDGEIYFLVVTPDGRGIYSFERTESAER